MKPDWKDAPEGAKWLAQDASGLWGWYGRDPHICVGLDPEEGFWCEADGTCLGDAGYGDPNPEGWQDTLEPRP